MSVEKDFADLKLDADERLLRRHGLRDSEGEWTSDAVSVLDQMLLDERRSEMIEKCKAIDEMKKESKS